MYWIQLSRTPYFFSRLPNKRAPHIKENQTNKKKMNKIIGAHRSCFNKKHTLGLDNN